MDYLILITLWNLVLLAALLALQPAVRVMGIGPAYAMSNFDKRMDEGVFAAVSFLIELCAAREIHIPAGTLVSCGALSGIHDVAVGSVAEVSLVCGLMISTAEKRVSTESWRVIPSSSANACGQ